MNPYRHRNYIVATIFIAIVCNYLDRQLLSILKPEILTYFNIGDLEYAWIVNVFLICYALMYPVGGMLIGRFGSRKVMFGGILLWSLACIGGGISRNIAEFTFFRGLLGVAEPIIFSGQVVVVTVWFEKQKRALANSLCQFGGSIGAMIAPAVIAWLSHYLPWNQVFIIAGLIGIIISLIWFMIYSEPPKEILDQSTAAESGDDGKTDEWAFSLKDLFKTRSLWGCLLVRLVSDPVWYFCSFWLPGFLRTMGERQGLSQQQTLDMIQYIGGVPFLVGAVSGVLASAISDRMVRHGTPSLLARKKIMLASVIFAPLCALVPYVSEWQGIGFNARLALVIIIFCLIAAMCLTWLYNIGVVMAESFPLPNVSTVVGIACGAGAIGGSVFNQLVGSMLNTMGNKLFFIMSLLHIIAAFVLWKMVRREPKPEEVKAN